MTAPSTHAITDYGAVDGERATAAFRAAVDACADAGGGTVRVPPGDYEVGSVELVDDLALSLAPGATVHASADEDEYRSPPEYEGPDGERPFLLARDCTNVTVEGRGTIDGHGTDVMEMDEPIRGHSGQSDEHPLVSDAPPRPRQGDAFLDPSRGTEEWPVAKPDFRPGPVLLFDGCENVAIRGVTLRDMPAWTVSLRDCDGVRVAGVDVRNHMLIPNCDGIAVESSRDVRVSDCAVRACDDAVTLTARAGAGPCENVVAANCTLTSRACAVKIGSETSGTVRNVQFRNCAAYASNRGLGIQHRDGGDVENVLFSDVTVETRLPAGPWWGKAEPIYVTSVPRDGDTDLGSVRTVRFSNVVARGENGAVVYGHEDATIEDVRLDAVSIEVRAGSNADRVGGNLDLQPTSVGPPIRERDAPAVLCENVAGLELVDISVDWADPPAYCTHGIECEGVEDVLVDGFDGAPARPAAAAIALRDTETITVRNSRARPGTETFLAADGTGDERLFANNDLADATRGLDGDTDFTKAGNVGPR